MVYLVDTATICRVAVPLLYNCIISHGILNDVFLYIYIYITLKRKLYFCENSYVLYIQREMVSS